MTGTKSMCTEVGQESGFWRGIPGELEEKGQNTVAKGITYMEIKS